MKMRVNRQRPLGGVQVLGTRKRYWSRARSVRELLRFYCQNQFLKCLLYVVLAGETDLTGDVLVNVLLFAGVDSHG